MHTTRVRRGLGAALATALATVGLSLIAPAAEAAAVTTSITPTSAVPGSTTSFTVRIDGTADDTGAVKITVPATFTGVTLTSFDSPTVNGRSWQTPTKSGAAYVFRAFDPSSGQGQAADYRLVSGQSLLATFQAVVPSPATPTSYTWSIAVSDSQSANANGINTVVTSPSVQVGQLTQTITFAPVGDKAFGDADFAVSATGGASGNPVVLAASGACTGSGNGTATVHLTGAGSCVVDATQAAGNGYTAATARLTVPVARGAQTISFAGPATSPRFGDEPLTLGATASSGLAVGYATSGPCSEADGRLTLTGAGTCTVTASQGGDADWLAAPDVAVEIGIAKAQAHLTLQGLGPVTYDGATHTASATTDPAGLETVTIAYEDQDGEAVAAPRAAGTYLVTASLDNADYEAEEISGTITIDPKPVTGAFTVADKTYDGTTTATVTGTSLPGAVLGDDVELTGGTATFASRHAGEQTARLTGAALTGADAENYELEGVADATGTISPLEVTGAVQAGDKEYDGTTTAVVEALDLAGRIGQDDVSVVVDSADFDTADAGEGKTVTARIHLAGADQDDYELTSDEATSVASVWARVLTGSFTAVDKVYDGTTTASVVPPTGTSLDRVVAGDDVSLVVTGARFADKAAALDKTVTADLSLGGLDRANYQLVSSSATSTADITPRPLTGSFTVTDKVWDGTRSATIATRSLATPVAGDDVALTGGTAQFDSAAVGTGKTVTGTGFALSGADRDNYSLVSSQLTTTASISPLYAGKGFYAPVDMTPVGSTRVFNTLKGGQTVPLKFELFNARTMVEQTSLSALGADAAQQAAAFRVQQVTCATGGATEDAVELTTTGGTAVRYDTTGGQYVQNWKTPTTVGACYAASVTAVDGTTVGAAYFKILR